jgi:hypothetical protein
MKTIKLISDPSYCIFFCYKTDLAIVIPLSQQNRYKITYPKTKEKKNSIIIDQCNIKLGISKKTFF